MFAKLRKLNEDRKWSETLTKIKTLNHEEFKEWYEKNRLNKA